MVLTWVGRQLSLLTRPALTQFGVDEQVQKPQSRLLGRARERQRQYFKDGAREKSRGDAFPLIVDVAVARSGQDFEEGVMKLHFDRGKFIERLCGGIEFRIRVWEKENSFFSSLTNSLKDHLQRKIPVKTRPQISFSHLL